MALIEVSALHKHYMNGSDCVSALSGIDLAVGEGTFLGAMGASGSGKSTLLATLGGLSSPTSGQVNIDDIDLYALPGERLADFRREFLGFVFQSHNLVSYLTALENVMLPLAVKSSPRRDKRDRAEQVLVRVGLSGRLSHLPNQLSGGEQERVAIARALVNQPTLLLADEPTGSLDSQTSHEVMELLAEFNAEGLTIVMVTHNEENRRYFNRTLLLRDGRVADDQQRPCRAA
jgi:putative ABC transport system ATP-binding protein